MAAGPALIDPPASPFAALTPDTWIALAIGLAAIVAAALLARRRIASGAAPPSRAGRVFRTASAFAAAIAAIYGSHAAMQPGGASQALTNFVPTLLVLLGASLLLFGCAELVLGLFHPRRDRRWLIAALLAFALAAIFGLAGPVWLAQGGIALRPGLLLPAEAAAAAALIWWSNLPAPPRSPGLFL